VPVLIVDEIQHFNRKEQDAFLTFIEEGKIILIALTTENPSFYVNSALLSRLSVFVFNRLTEDDLKKILINAYKKDEIIKNTILKKVFLITSQIFLMVMQENRSISSKTFRKRAW